MPRTPAQNAVIRRERRTQIIIAARQVFADRGFYSTRMSDIAKTAEVSQGTLYHYFRSKDELFLALFENIAEEVEAVARALPTVDLSPTKKFEMITELGFIFLEANEALLPVWVEFWAYAARNPEAAERFRDFFKAQKALYTHILHEGIAGGEFNPIDVDVLAALPLVILDGAILLSSALGKDDLDPQQLLSKTLPFIFQGLHRKKAQEKKARDTQTKNDGEEGYESKNHTIKSEVTYEP